MAIPFSELPENPLNFKKFNKNAKNQNLEELKKTNPNLKSFWAFLSSIFIYISVFYIFNLSPSTLICTTKFWFFISNTLILIAAVDFAAFSHGEGHVIKYTTTTPSSKSNIIISSYDLIKDNTATSAESDITISRHVVKDTTATSPKGGAIVLFEATTWHDVEEEEKKIISGAVYDHHEKKRKKCARSNSENAVMVAAAAEEEGKAMVLHRTLSEKHDRQDHGLLEDEKVNEFSQMSNEEVNKRVEEFIRRFNRQIRLQAVRNRHNLEMNEIH